MPCPSAQHQERADLSHSAHVTRCWYQHCTRRVRLRLPSAVALPVSSHSGKGPFSSLTPSDRTPPVLTAARRPSCLGTEPARQQTVNFLICHQTLAMVLAAHCPCIRSCLQ